MGNKHNRTLSWYEDNANEIRLNPDGSITFIFDEARLPGDTQINPTSEDTISKEEYEKAKADPNYIL